VSEKNTILIADNEENIRTVLRALLEQEDFDVVSVANGKEAQQILHHQSFSAVITDLKMPEVDGMSLLYWLREHHPSLPVIMITAFATVETAVKALKLGAFDYITKPFDLDEMKTVVEKACRTHHLANQDFFTPIDSETDLEMIGQNLAMKEIYQVIRKTANSPSPVLISGESGTGKGLVANALHQLSLRQKHPFIQVNCAAIPETLLESELFGYERGAFTGAITSKPGRFELAQNGTLFLDEIGEIDPQMQVKLLHAVQNQRFERVGGVKTIEVDVRLVTATNRDLQKEIKRGNFREDLYYRLNVLPIHLPPLRKRIDDIPLLVRFFLKEHGEKLGKPNLEIHSDTLAHLTHYAWPGNIRELENILERAIVLSDNPVIMPEDLPREIFGDAKTTDSVDQDNLKETLKHHGAALERELIRKALEETKGNVTQTARKLGISRKSLQIKMLQYGLRD